MIIWTLPLKGKRPHYLCMNFISNPFQTFNQSSQKPSPFFKSDKPSHLWFRKNSFSGRMYTPICAITLRSDNLFTNLQCFTSQRCHKRLFLKELSSWWFLNDLDYYWIIIKQLIIILTNNSLLPFSFQRRWLWRW